jgi:hypothetical protein
MHSQNMRNETVYMHRILGLKPSVFTSGKLNFVFLLNTGNHVNFEQIFIPRSCHLRIILDTMARILC